MAAELENDLFLRACFSQKTERTPVWLMRQAGRYLPEYRQTRAKAGSFLDLAKSPEYATEVTLQPIDRYGLDAAILFSDILTVPDAMGLGLTFDSGEGPKFLHPISSEEDVKKLPVADMEQLRYVFDAVASISKALTSNGKQQVPLIGFSGSPWTLACYMIEGGGSKDFAKTKKMLYDRKDLIRKILDTNVQSITEYLSLQADSGAQALMIFDTWGGLLTPGDYLEHSLAPMSAIISSIKSNPKYKDLPIILFTKGGGLWLSDIAQSGANVIGLDWTVDLKNARQTINSSSKNSLAIQGNLDPSILLANPAEIDARVMQLFQGLSMADVAGGNPLDGHIFNLGHGISQFTPPENVTVLVDAVKRYSTSFRASAQ
jgi:uroporphyrinogen decarboxylase